MGVQKDLSVPELPAIGVVEELSEADRAMLCSYGGFSFHQSGSTVIQQGSPQDSLFLVLSGELHARREDDGREILIGRIRQGESFGEVNIFDPAEASATVVAVSPSQIWKIERNALVDFLAAYPEASVQLLSRVASVLSRRLRGLALKLEDKVEYDVLISEIDRK